MDNTIRSRRITTVQHPNQKSRHFLFNGALLISDAIPVHLKTSAILYNLALAHHLVGGGESASQKIMSAKRLYLLALDLVKKHSEDEGSKQAVLLSLAIANNLAEVYLEQSHDLAEAKKCFSLSHKILTYVGSLTNGRDPADAEYNFFFLNSMVRGVGALVATPAA